jgi:sodium/hydrogen antiporter
MDGYDLLLAVVGAVSLAATALRLLLVGRPLSFPLAYVVLGFALFSLLIDLPRADPIAHGDSSSGSASWQ